MEGLAQGFAAVGGCSWLCFASEHPLLQVPIKERPEAAIELP